MIRGFGLASSIQTLTFTIDWMFSDDDESLSDGYKH